MHMHRLKFISDISLQVFVHKILVRNRPDFVKLCISYNTPMFKVLFKMCLI